MITERVEHTYQLKRGTAERLAEVNPVLLQGEPGFEINTYKLKIGDGFTPYNLLPYVNASSILIVEELPLTGISNILYINKNDDYSIWIWDNEKFIPLSSGSQEAVALIPREQATNVLDYNYKENSVPYFYGVYGDKNDNYVEKQGLIKGSSGKLMSIMIEEETDPEKKIYLEKGILPDHSYADVNTVAIRDGNASIPVGIIQKAPKQIDEEGHFNPAEGFEEDKDYLWYGAAVPVSFAYELHGRSLEYAQFQRDVAIKETLRQANIDNLHNGSGEGSLQQKSCNAISDYNIAMGNETQAGVKGFKVVSTSVNIDNENPYASYATLNITHNLQFPAEVETILLLGDEICHFDLGQHWYNKYQLGGSIWSKYSNLNKDGTGALYLFAIYPNEYPVTEQRFQLGSDDTDNWVWIENLSAYVVVDKNGNEVRDIDWNPTDFDFGTTPINQYVGGFATGFNSLAAGYGAFSAGRETKAIGNYSTALGRQTIADYASMAIGLKTHALGQQSFASGNTTKAIGSCAFATGNQSIAKGEYSSAFGVKTEANGPRSTTFGSTTKANGTHSFAIGNGTIVNGDNSFGGGASGSVVDGNYSFAFGINTTAGTLNADGTRTSGSFAIGSNCKATGNYAFAGGANCNATAWYTFSYGQGNQVTNSYAVALGQGILAKAANQIAVGKYNKENYQAMFVVGNGTSDDDRYDLFAVNKDKSITLGNTKLTEDKLQALVNFDATNVLTKSNIDQTFNGNSENAQSGKALNEQFAAIDAKAENALDGLGTLSVRISAPKENIKLIDTSTGKCYAISITDGKLTAEEVTE